MADLAQRERDYETFRVVRHASCLVGSYRRDWGLCAFQLPCFLLLLGVVCALCFRRKTGCGRVNQLCGSKYI